MKSEEISKEEKEQPDYYDSSDEEVLVHYFIMIQPSFRIFVIQSETFPYSGMTIMIISGK